MESMMKVTKYGHGNITCLILNGKTEQCLVSRTRTYITT